MPTARYTADGGHYRVGGHGFDPGDERTVDSDLASYLDDHDDFEVLDAAGDETVHEEDGPPDPDAVDGESGTLPFNPEDHTNDEVAEKVADIDEPAALRALLSLEAEQKDRDGATEAIQDRLDELEG